jgi:hypothetical protein
VIDLNSPTAMMTRRQGLAYKLAGIPATDARLHEELTIRSARGVAKAYTIVWLTWIGDVPHWRAGVTLMRKDSILEFKAMPIEKCNGKLQRMAYDLATNLLDGVGVDPAIHSASRGVAIVTKPLRDEERANLKPRENQHVVKVADVAERDLVDID